MKEVQYIFFKEKVQIFNIQKNILYQVPNLSVYQKKKKEKESTKSIQKKEPTYSK